MLGDTAVAVHPDDERYKHLVGKHVILPLVGRRIPIIADEYADPEKGHRRGEDHPGPRLQRFRGRPAAPLARSACSSDVIILPNDSMPERGRRGYHGLDRFVARKRIVAIG